MPLCLELIPENTHLLILGAGGQARRKAADFLAGGARVTAVSDLFGPEWQPLRGSFARDGQLTLVQGPLTEDLFAGKSLFLAAARVREQNDEACRRAAAHGLVCVSVTAGLEASARFMKAESAGGLVLAAGTGGQYPALCAPALRAALPAVRPLAERLPLLASLRTRLQRLLPGMPELHTVLRGLAWFSRDELEALSALGDCALQEALRAEIPRVLEDAPQSSK